MIAQGLFKLAALGMVGALVLAYIVGHNLGVKQTTRWTSRLFLGYAIAHCLFILILWLNHISFPLNLEAMELLRLQHVQRVLQGQVLYPDPSPDFVALAYNPLSYLLTVPLTWIFGANLFSLRLFAILGILGSAAIIFLTVRQETRSNWWSIMAVGLFASAYGVMDTYLDNGHSDSWLLFTVLLGCRWLGKGRNIAGMLLLIAAFWIKQHGAIFAIAGLLFILCQQGWRKTVLPALLTTLLIPVLYIFMPVAWLGPKFHYFTWDVPRHWSEVSPATLGRYVSYLAKHYLPLVVLSAIAYLSTPFKLRSMSVWTFMLPFAMLTGLMGALDPGGNNNVFIPMGTWLIVLGTISLKQLQLKFPQFHRRWGVPFAAIGLAFVLFLYNPASVIVSPQAQTTYRDFVSYLKSLNGTVYIPWVGQLQDSYRLAPAVHWVPMEDLVRGKNGQRTDPAVIRQLMKPLTQPKGKAFLMLNNDPLAEYAAIRFLTDFYVLEQDTGERFKALSTLPKRFSINHPRYLYRYDPQAARQLRNAN